MASAIYERVRSLYKSGSWDELKAMEPELPQLSGEELFRSHSAIWHAYYKTASDAEDWRAARRNAEIILLKAPRDSWFYTWALHAIACACSNLGLASETAAYAKAFLREVVNHPALHDHAPHSWQQLAFVALIQRQYRRAVQCYRLAMNGFAAVGLSDEAARSRLFLVWTLLKAGQHRLARDELPSETLPAWMPIWHAIRALFAASERNWDRAKEEATTALAYPFEPVLSHVAAEMCLVLAQVTLRHGARAEAVSWMKRATEFATRQGQGVFTRLVLATRAEGGDFLAAVASRGSGGYHPEASLSTGVGG